jgi:hypothetical protein
MKRGLRDRTEYFSKLQMCIDIYQYISMDILLYAAEFWKSGMEKRPWSSAIF